MRSILLWLVGVPIPIIILLAIEVCCRKNAVNETIPITHALRNRDRFYSESVKCWGVRAATVLSNAVSSYILVNAANHALKSLARAACSKVVSSIGNH